MAQTRSCRNIRASAWATAGSGSCSLVYEMGMAESTTEHAQPQRWAPYLFFLSGMTGLIYEILWTRRLSLIFGHSVLAVSTVLTAYMAGLALGSWAGGRWGDRQARHRAPGWFIRAYGVLEAGIGIWALLSLPLLAGVEKIYLGLSGQGWQGHQLYLVILVVSVVVMLPPTLAMGATLPLVANLFRETERSLGLNLSRLYATNTLGAMTGAALAGFLLLPWLGLKAAVLGTAVLNILIGLFSLRLGAHQWPRPVTAAAETGRRGKPFLPLVFAMAGFASMVFQLAWTRGLAICLGSSIYAFSSILVIFLAGIAVGSAFYAFLFRKRQAQLQDLGKLFIGIGLTGTLSAWLLGEMPLLFASLFPLVQDYARGPFLLNFVLIGLLLLPPTLMMGLAFPMVTEIYHRDEGRLGSSIGIVYGANTLGCIAGSFLGGFFCMPYLGVQNSIKLAAAFNLTGALLCFGLSRGRLKPAWLALGLVLMTVNLLQPAWNQGLLMSGLALRPPSLQKKAPPRTFDQPTFTRDGISCSVGMFIQDASQIYMRVNGKVDASRGLNDRRTSVCIPILTLLYQPQPKRVGVIGLGSGLTLGVIAAAPRVEKAECAELEPVVVDCDRYWAAFNRQALANPKSVVHEQDGRAFVLGSPEGFDAIISIPSNPWIAGIGNLYTRDFFDRSRQRLNPGGIYLQWCNLYAISLPDLLLVIKSFYSAYPHGSIWTTGGDIVLIGSSTPLHCDLKQFEEFYQSDAYTRNLLAELGIASPEEFLGQYVCDREKAMTLVQGAKINQDDLPILEFSAPLSLYRRENGPNNRVWVMDLLRQNAKLPLPETDRLLEGAAWGRVSLLSAITVLPKTWSDPALAEYFRLLTSYSGDDLEQRLRNFLAGHNLVRVRLECAQRSFNLKRWEDTIAYLPEASLAGAPDSAVYAANLLRGQALFNLNRFQEALPSLQAALNAQPASDTASAVALAHLTALEFPQAAQAAQQALSIHRYDPRAYLVLGHVALEAGKFQDAYLAFCESSRISPHFNEAWLMRSQAALQLGLFDDAWLCFQTVLRNDPRNPDLRTLLQRASDQDRRFVSLLQRLR